MTNYTFTLETGSTTWPNATIQNVIIALDSLVFGDFDNDFMVLERNNTDNENSLKTFLQARLYSLPYNLGMLLIEYRDGKEAKQYHAYLENGQPIIDLFASYLKNDDAWLEMVVWRDITFHFEDLRPYHPDLKSAKDFFSEEEYVQILEKQKHRKDAMKAIADDE